MSDGPQDLFLTGKSTRTEEGEIVEAVDRAGNPVAIWVTVEAIQDFAFHQVQAAAEMLLRQGDTATVNGTIVIRVDRRIIDDLFED
jgi:hypothetical protein